MSSPRLSRAFGTAALPAVLLIAALVLFAPPAGGHGPEGRVEILVAEPSGTGTVHVEAGVVFANDGELAEEAAVSATLTGPGGTVVGPAPLSKIRSARYGADLEVPVPGPWTVTVDSTGPAGTATGAVEVPVPVPTTTAAPTTVATTVPAPPAAAPPDPVAAPASPPPGLVVPGAAAVFAVSVVAGYLVVRRRAGLA